MNDARASRNQKLARADELLNSLDGWLLEQLGIEVKPFEQRTGFAVRASVAHSRVDVAFHAPKAWSIRRGLEKGRFPSRTIYSICSSVRSGFAAGRQDQATDMVEGTPHLRPLNLSIYGELTLEGTKFVPTRDIGTEDYCQINEVLFNNTNSEKLVGKSAVFELETPCACSNHMTRLTLTKEAYPHFVARVFNALRGTGYLGILATNFNNQAGINTTTLGAMQVPLPNLETQQRLANELRNRRQEARRLRAEAETEWEATKQHFENQLLGEA